MGVNLLTSGWSDIEQWLGFGGKPGYVADPGMGMTTPIDTGLATVMPDTSLDSLRLAPSNPLAAPKAMQGVGLFTAIAGGVGRAIGGYYAAQAQQYQLRSQELNYQYQADVARVNARSAEYDAQSILESGKSQVASYTMQAGQAKASAKTAMAGRGLVLGSGSTAEVEASMDLVKDINVLNINSNAVRAAEAERAAGVNYRNQALLESVSAQNLKRSADSISPFGAAFATLLSSASQVSSQWLAGQNRQMLATGNF